jgi:hypothetical protein
MHENKSSEDLINRRKKRNFDRSNLSINQKSNLIIKRDEESENEKLTSSLTLKSQLNKSHDFKKKDNMKIETIKMSSISPRSSLEIVKPEVQQQKQSTGGLHKRGTGPAYLQKAIQ